MMKPKPGSSNLRQPFKPPVIRLSRLSRVKQLILLMSQRRATAPLVVPVAANNCKSDLAEMKEELGHVQLTAGYLTVKPFSWILSTFGYCSGSKNISCRFRQVPGSPDNTVGSDGGKVKLI